jgi:hypothetical protein
MINWLKKKWTEEKWVIIFLIILSMLRALHEISKFRIEWSWIPSWGYPFGIESPPFDSYHVYGGLFVLIFIAGFRVSLRDEIINRWYEIIPIVLIQFGIYFYSFNWFYHVIFMKPTFMQFEYVVPFLKFIMEII